MTSGLAIVSLEDLAELPRYPRAIAIGNFDGVHRGHQQLLTALEAPARAHGAVRCALTFHPHPATLVAPERAPQPLTTLQERITLLRRHGAEEVVVLCFSEALSRLSARAFAEQVLRRGLGACYVAVGENFRFAHRQEGDVKMLAALGAQQGFAVSRAPLLTERGLPLSSSRIRKLLSAGAVTRAARMLGRPFGISGPVIPGRGVGSKQTVPTLNLALPATIIPADGVYVTDLRDLTTGAPFAGITNIGFRPTFDDQHPERSIETFVLGPLPRTPAAIRLHFLARLRGEQRFDNAETLKAQILRDVARARAFHRRATRWDPAVLRPL